MRARVVIGWFGSPVMLLIFIWVCSAALIVVGPINYSGQPSALILSIIATGIALFAVGQSFGGKVAQTLARHFSQIPEAPSQVLDRTVVVTSMLGILSIVFIAIDRTILSGVDNSDYAAFLRCAPEFIDYIHIRRTPLIYIGYIIFSFGFVSLALFLLSDKIRGWPAYLAQLSSLSPIGYALLYSGRMPMLLLAALITSVGLVRLLQGRTLFPRGHLLGAKVLILVAAFGIYSNLVWESRRSFCDQMRPLVIELRKTLKIREIDSVHRLTKIREALKQPKRPPPPDYALRVMRDEWDVEPRKYLLDSIERGSMSPRVSLFLVANYFYLTHGMMTLDRIYEARHELTPFLGVYQVGPLSPLIRVVAPDSDIIKSQNRQLRIANIYGFFPTAFGAAFVDFGLVGGALYILLWGMLGGWAFVTCRRTKLVTPGLVLTFVLASVILSPIQGPLGVANSALVLFSAIAVGFWLDLPQIVKRRREVASTT
jgi:hypothetical protein